MFWLIIALIFLNLLGWMLYWDAALLLKEKRRSIEPILEDLLVAKTKIQVSKAVKSLRNIY